MLEYPTLDSLFSTHFDAWGVARIEPIEDEIDRLKKWIKNGYHAEMQYMARNIELRANPCELLPDARSMIMVLMNYYPHEWQPDNLPRIAAYAYGNDYHHIVKSKLTQIAEEINKIAPHKYAVFCDSAPVMERAWAVRAGLGWIGRNGMLVNPKLGTFTFIGTLITTLNLEPSRPMKNRCGTCQKCIEACPTGAILGNKTIDARRCLSYQTIEKRGDIDNELIDLAGNTLYGCDRCQLACPWNRFAKPHNHPELMQIDGIFNLDWASMTRSEFNNQLKFSPMQRAGLKKIKTRYNQITTNSSFLTTNSKCI
ncbi:MAG: tRNA epoxyqueuosine(34) reductase QueG [Paludibacteraceae bacterium]|nr:tRNA epoxyqueuosine(34) reductase QueG [Paludibacteraceae bacterium]